MFTAKQFLQIAAVCVVLIYASNRVSSVRRVIG